LILFKFKVRYFKICSLENKSWQEAVGSWQLAVGKKIAW
jgi:hypothetical protein